MTDYNPDIQLFVDDVLADCGIPKAIEAQPILDPIEWITSEFHIPETRGPMPLHPYQQAVLREAYARDESGHYKYSIVVWSDIKKSIKSSIAAAVILERARNLYFGSIKIVANDLKQADSRVAFYARRAIQLNPKLSAIYHMRPSGYTMDYLPSHTRIEAIAVDPKGEAGSNDDLIVFSELWAANQKAALRMWTEMTLSPTKFGQSQRWVETYAGFEGESPILEQLYTSGVKEGRQLDLSYDDHDLSDLEVYANEPARLLCLWNTQPRLPWQTKAYYAQESAVLQESEFNRVHRNAWQSGQHAFVPIEWWDACRRVSLPDNRHNEVVIALDAAVDNDCFGMLALSRHDDKYAVRFVRKWSPPQGGKIEFKDQNDPDNVEYPLGQLKRLCKQYNVICIVYDPYQLESFASDCRAMGFGLLEPMNQGSPRLVADKACYDAIRDQDFIHSGEPDLREHIQNADSTAEEKDTLRIVKRAQNKKIDLTVCLSMAREVAHVYLPG